MIQILVASTSSIKLEAVTVFYRMRLPPNTYTIEGYDCNCLNLPPQPINASTFLCARARLDYMKSQKPNYDIYIAIENGIQTSLCYDFCVAIIENQFGVGCYPKFDKDEPSNSVHFYDRYMYQLQKMDQIQINQISGYSQTIGQIISQEYPHINDKDWFAVCGSQCNRQQQIINSLNYAFTNLNDSVKSKQSIISKYQTYVDYPKVGINFQDVFSILNDGNLLVKIVNLLINKYQYSQIDYVVGLEARGFCLGTLLAYELTRVNLMDHAVGFLPVRKVESKLPGSVVKISYVKEYGIDAFQMQTGIQKGSRVLIIDDFVALGGSLRAGIDLVTQLDCQIVDCCVLREEPILREQAQKQIGRPYTILLND